MSQTDVDICNEALLRIGTGDLIATLSEASIEARLCRKVYDLARQSTLQRAHWSFATQYTALAQSANTPVEYQYSYGLPSNVLSVIGIILRPNVDPALQGTIPSSGALLGQDSNAQPPFEIINEDLGKFLVTDFPPPCTIKFTEDIENTTRFDPLFIDALAYKIASDIAMALTGTLALQQSMFNGFLTALASAKGKDANEVKVKSAAGNDLINSRR